jgi:hypothetical protein
MPLVIKDENEELRIVWAEVYAPNRPDSDGEFMDEQGVRDMAYNFMRAKKLDQVDHAHSNELVEGAHVVESFIARKGDPLFIEGAWVVGVHIPTDDDWEKVKTKKWNGFSVEANVSKELVEVEIDIPPVIHGTTFKADDGHQHTFYVAYDDNAKFLGGRTDVVNGHFHTIKRGTITDEVDGHAHTFSHVEDLFIQE